MIRTKSRFAAALVLLALPAFAFAIVSPYALRIEASNALGSGAYEVPVTELTYNPVTDAYTWSLPLGVDIETPGGDLILSLTNSTLTYRNDPRINLGFAAQAGALDATVTVLSGVLSFPGINPATTNASASLTLTDNNANGGQLSGVGSLFRPVTNLGTFGLFVGGFSVIPGQSLSQGANAGPSVWGGTVTQMQSSFAFTVSASDSVSGTSLFNTVPEPASLVLLGLGLLLRRR